MVLFIFDWIWSYLVMDAYDAMCGEFKLSLPTRVK